MHKTHGLMWAWRSIFARGKPRQVGLWSRRRLSPTLSGETQQKLDFSADKGQELRNAGAAGTGARAPERCHGSGNASSEYRQYAGNLPLRDDQAVALRRRRLSDPMAALGDPVQYAPIRWHVSTPWRRTPSAGRCWDRASISGCTLSMKPTGGLSPTRSFA